MPESLWSATFYPEPEAPAYVDKLVGAGVEVFKVHVQVGEFHLDDPALDPVWGILEDAGTPIVIHAGSGPVGNEFTGPDPLRRVLAPLPAAGRGHRAHGCAGVRRVPRPRGDPRAGLPGHHDGVHRLLRGRGAVPAASWSPRLVDLQPKVLLGSDFPTIPYPYAHQLEGLARLGLGDDWLRDVCWNNGMRIFGRGR